MRTFYAWDQTISTSRTLVLAVVWKFAKAYRTRPGWRQDWDRRTP